MMGVPRLRGCACACSCVCRCVRGLTVTSITPAPLGVPRLRGCVRVFVGVCGYEYYASAYDAGCPKTPRVCVSLPRSLCTSLCPPHPLFVLVLLQIAPSQLRLPVLQLCLTLLEAPGPQHSSQSQLPLLCRVCAKQGVITTDQFPNIRPKSLAQGRHMWCHDNVLDVCNHHCRVTRKVN